MLLSQLQVMTDQFMRNLSKIAMFASGVMREMQNGRQWSKEVLHLQQQWMQFGEEMRRPLAAAEEEEEWALLSRLLASLLPPWL